MFCCSRTFRRAIVACVLVVTLTSVGRSQLLAPGQWPWPATCYPGTYWDGFQLLDDTLAPTCALKDAAIRITLGSTWTEPVFAQLGVADSAHLFGGFWRNWFSAIAPMHATVLRSSWGDLVLSATTCLPSPTHAGPPPHASIHLGTTPSPPAVDTTVEQPHDLERMTLWWDGKAAIGTQGIIPAAIMGDSGHTGEYDLLHLHVPCIPLSYTVDTTAGYAVNQLMAMKLSYGGIGDAQLRFAELGFDRGHQLSSFSSDQDLVLSTNSDQSFGPNGSGIGDMIIDNRRIGKAIRFGTSADTSFPDHAIDRERLTIANNGNLGIDLPPDSVTGLAKPLDQVQIGGGVVPYPGNSYVSPGLTIYGGNRYENTYRPNGGMYPGEWRYISFNHWVDHTDTGTSRTHRFDPESSSEIDFSENSGGNLCFNCEPYDATRGLNDFSRGTTMALTGTGGLSMWVYNSAASVVYHHLFDVLIPGQTPWPITRNTNGLFIHHTPVLITSDSTSTPSINFQDLPVRPDMGDDTTWDLVVNGPALFKEAFVNETDWPDYVFRPGFKLKPLEEVEKYTTENHHLPELPSANQMEGTGVPLGRTEAAITKQVEEMMLYIEQQNHRIDALETKVRELTKEKGNEP